MWLSLTALLVLWFCTQKPQTAFMCLQGQVVHLLSGFGLHLGHRVFDECYVHNSVKFMGLGK